MRGFANFQGTPNSGIWSGPRSSFEILRFPVLVGGFCTYNQWNCLTNCIDFTWKLVRCSPNFLKCIFSPFLQSQVNHHSAASNETYQERLARLEGDKESLILQVGAFGEEPAYPVAFNSVAALGEREGQGVFCGSPIPKQFQINSFLKQSKSNWVCNSDLGFQELQMHLFIFHMNPRNCPNTLEAL